MLIPSKLSRPVRLDHTVVRERLLAKLSGANNFRLALITSPAGYGKTTLISQWAAGCNFAFFSGLFDAQFWAGSAQPKSPELTANYC